MAVAKYAEPYSATKDCKLKLDPSSQMFIFFHFISEVSLLYHKTRLPSTNFVFVHSFSDLLLHSITLLRFESMRIGEIFVLRYNVLPSVPETTFAWQSCAIPFELNKNIFEWKASANEIEEQTSNRRKTCCKCAIPFFLTKIGPGFRSRVSVGADISRKITYFWRSF